MQLQWQHFLLIFLRTNVQIHVSYSIPPRTAHYEELFMWGTRHHCPMEIGACADRASERLLKIGRYLTQFFYMTNLGGLFFGPVSMHWSLPGRRAAVKHTTSPSPSPLVLHEQTRGEGARQGGRLCHPRNMPEAKRRVATPAQQTVWRVSTHLFLS